MSRKVSVFLPSWLGAEVACYVVGYLVLFVSLWAFRRVGVPDFLSLLVSCVVLTLLRDVVRLMRYFSTVTYSTLLTYFILKQPVPPTQIMHDPRTLTLLAGLIIAMMIDAYSNRLIIKPLLWLFYFSREIVYRPVSDLFREFWGFVSVGLMLTVFSVVFGCFSFLPVGLFLLCYVFVSHYVRGLKTCGRARYFSFLGRENPIEEYVRGEVRNYSALLVKYVPDVGTYFAYGLGIATLFTTLFTGSLSLPQYVLIALCGAYIGYEGVKAWAWYSVESLGDSKAYVVSFVLSVVLLGAVSYPFNLLMSASALFLSLLSYPSLRRYLRELRGLAEGDANLVVPVTEAGRVFLRVGRVSAEVLECLPRGVDLTTLLLTLALAVMPCGLVLVGAGRLVVVAGFLLTSLFSWTLLKQRGVLGIYVVVPVITYALSTTFTALLLSTY